MTPRERDAKLRAIASDPRLFRQALLIDADGGPRRLAEVCDPWQRQDFEALDPAWQSIAGYEATPPHRRAWLERPRGHDKTGSLAAMVSHALFSSRRRLAGVVAAADQEQAGLLRDAIGKLVELNEWLADFIEVQRGRVIGKRNGEEFGELKILSADAPSSYGLTPDFIVCDEVTHWVKRDLWDALFSAAAKRARCLLAVICNAGFEQSWVWPLREAIRTDPSWYFHALDGPQASWITPERLDEQRRLLPGIAYRRLWLNQWSGGSGDAIDETQITAATTLAGPPDPAEPGWLSVAGVDLGLKRDASAIVVLQKHVGYSEEIEREPPPPPAPGARLLAAVDENCRLTSEQEPEYRQVMGTGRLRLAAVLIFRPNAGGNGSSVDVSSIERAVLDLHSRWRFAAVGCDPWQARYLIERLQQASVAIEPVDFVGANLKSMCEATLSAFSEKLIELWPEPALLADLRNLRVVEKSYGVRLESPRRAGGEGTFHGDAACGLSIAAHIAKKFAFHPQAVVNRPLICWP